MAYRGRVEQQPGIGQVACARSVLVYVQSNFLVETTSPRKMRNRE